MNHLNQDDLVLSYYGEPSLDSERREHLAQCEECRAELAALAVFLDRVTPVEVPDPDAGFEARTWDRLQWRLRGERKNRSAWTRWGAVAAVIALAFFAGLLLNRRSTVDAPQVATTTAPAAQPATAKQQQASRDRVLLVVVGEHMDQSERILVELTNLSANGNTDITTERDRAQELLASNRLYRTSALDRGEDSVATLLDELEPVLLQIAHAPDQVSAEELRAMQKRVEAKGLVFKLRVVKADVQRDVVTAAPSTDI